MQADVARTIAITLTPTVPVQITKFIPVPSTDDPNTNAEQFRPDITDFTIGQDQIQLNGFFTSPTDPAFQSFLTTLQAAANGVHTISDSHLLGVQITLTNVNVNQLHASDFIVHN